MPAVEKPQVGRYLAALLANLGTGGTRALVALRCHLGMIDVRGTKGARDGDSLSPPRDWEPRGVQSSVVAVPLLCVSSLEYMARRAPFAHTWRATAAGATGGG